MRSLCSHKCSPWITKGIKGFVNAHWWNIFRQKWFSYRHGIWTQWRFEESFDQSCCSQLLLFKKSSSILMYTWFATHWTAVLNLMSKVQIFERATSLKVEMLSYANRNELTKFNFPYPEEIRALFTGSVMANCFFKLALSKDLFEASIFDSLAVTCNLRCVQW